MSQYLKFVKIFDENPLYILDSNFILIVYKGVHSILHSPFITLLSSPKTLYKVNTLTSL